MAHLTSSFAVLAVKGLVELSRIKLLRLCVIVQKNIRLQLLGVDVNNLRRKPKKNNVEDYFKGPP